MRRRSEGFSLIELLVALVIFSIVSTAIYQLLVSNQRLYRAQAAKVDLSQNVRAAVSILPDELRELDADDPAGSDILGMTSNALTYKEMRSLYVLCKNPVFGSTQIVVAKNSFYGLSQLSTSDSLLVFAENDSTTRGDNEWLHASVQSISGGSNCPANGLGGTPSYTITLGNVTASQVAGVYSGAPVRGFHPSQVLLYQDASGAYWLGQRTYSAGGGWATTQPLVGPLTSSGLQFTYYDASGAITSTATNVARIAITVTGKSDPVTGGANGYLTQNLVAQVTLRNNR
ncbi:MAG TPA: prepilin-type N-terminal cleavage/methylation domain-containing protein [Gemmatimonadales bacterium]|nr:prepilin-type N-terminal cleavage/methylation domain-containing protein [Gemmatimonadales bacterium]